MKDKRIKDFIALQKKKKVETVKDLIEKTRKYERENNSKSFVSKV